MKKITVFTILLGMFGILQAGAQKSIQVPSVVKAALANKFPGARGVNWEKEKGNFEANWGGKSGEDNSAMFSPSGEFLELVKAIPASQLPAPALAYVKAKYKGAMITEAGLVTDSAGKVTYEAEVHRKDLIFDEKGNFLRVED